MQNQTVNLHVAGYDLKSIPTGEFGLDGGAMFGTVPRVLWEKTNPPDSENRIRMEARALLLKGNGRCILIDTGNGVDFVAKHGEKVGSKFSEIYDVKGAGLVDSLKKSGVSVDEITDVILTHLHFDHAGGATCERDGKILPTFPKATYYVQRENLETAQSPNIRERASYLKPNFEPLAKAGVLKLLDGEQQSLFPGISILLSHGHTRAHQVVKIADAEKTVYYCGDVIPTSSHVRSAWIMGYDLDPLQIIKEKRAILEDAAKSETRYLFFEHDPDCDLATVESMGEVGKEEYKVKNRFVLKN